MFSVASPYKLPTYSQSELPVPAQAKLRLTPTTLLVGGDLLMGPPMRRRSTNMRRMLRTPIPLSHYSEYGFSPLIRWVPNCRDGKFSPRFIKKKKPIELYHRAVVPELGSQ